VARLLDAGIDIDHVNRLGWTALLEAVILGEGGQAHTETVRTLIDADADVNLADREGTTALTHAERRGYGQIAGLLRSAGARSATPVNNTTPASGATSLHLHTRRCG
jgi:ankyrin repeat protein